MEENKQTKSTVLSWTLIGVAFVVIILFLLAKFVNEGKKAAQTQSHDKLTSYVSSWADQINSDIAFAGYCADMYTDMSSHDRKENNSQAVKYASSVVNNTVISHIIYCDGDKAVCDETGAKLLDFDASGYALLDDRTVLLLGEGDDFNTNPCIVIKYMMDSPSEYQLYYLDLSDISKKFRKTTYEDVSFGALVSKDGKEVAVFDKFRDIDSMFLQDGNVLKTVDESHVDKDDYNIFKAKLYNGNDAAIEAEHKDDARTIVFANVSEQNWYVVFGVRQNLVNKLTKNNFQAVRTTVIKLAIVIAVFAVFVISTIVFNSLRTKERGRVLEDKADTDLLTELNNKAATERKIQEYIAENPNARAMMFVLDIDNFKKINDTMGHAFGDTLLKTLGKEIKTEFRMTDIIGRTGGDEFMVFLKDVTDDLIIEREANRITKFFHDFKAGGDYVKYSATASIGAAIYPDDAKTFKDLYVAADQALYRAKKLGKNQLAFYNESAHK